MAATQEAVGRDDFEGASAMEPTTNENSQSIARDGTRLDDECPTARRSVRESLGQLQKRFREADARARALIRERPLVALTAAVAVGFVLRRLLPSGRR